MDESTSSPLAGRGRLAGRYVAVSVFNTVFSQSLLFLANSVWGWGGGWSNAFAAVIASIPAYLLSRAWVWEKSGTHSVRREVIPFWVITFIGLVVSTAAAEIADRLFGAGLLVNLASLGAYFVVWVGKFIVLDRLFAPDSTATDSTATDGENAA